MLPCGSPEYQQPLEPSEELKGLGAVVLGCTHTDVDASATAARSGQSSTWWALLPQTVVEVTGDE